MRTAQAAASQYPMGYPYPAGGMDNGQGLAQGQPMGGGEMQHFNMQQNPAGAVAGAQRQMINVAQLNPMLAGDANGSTNQPGDIPPLPPSSLIALLTIYSLLPLVSYTHHLHFPNNDNDIYPATVSLMMIRSGGGSSMDPNNPLARGQLTARLGGVPLQQQAMQPPVGMMSGMMPPNQQQPNNMMGGGMPMQQMAPGGQYPGTKE